MRRREEYDEASQVMISVHDEDPGFWGTCDHGVSLAPWLDCAQCEVREGDDDA